MHSEDEMENAQDMCDIKTEKEDDVVEEAGVHIEGTVGYNCAESLKSCCYAKTRATCSTTLTPFFSKWLPQYLLTSNANNVVNY